MSDTAPKDQNALLWNHTPTATARASRRGEVLFEFARESDHVRIRCELHLDGPEGYAYDVKFFRNEEFTYSHRFALRDAAEAWAHEERRRLEQDPLGEL